MASTEVIKLAKVGWLAAYDLRTENTMSNSISTLLLRNLSDVFGENDPVRRRAAIDAIFHEDAVFYDPKTVYFAVVTRLIGLLV